MVGGEWARSREVRPEWKERAMLYRAVEIIARILDFTLISIEQLWAEEYHSWGLCFKGSCWSLCWAEEKEGKIMSKTSWGCEEAIELMQERNNSSSRGGDKWSDMGCIWKIDPIWISDRLNVKLNTYHLISQD